MGRNTGISWCHHTFNMWWGCFKWSDGCKHCYAEMFNRRVHGRNSTRWDRDGARRFFGAEYWRQPLEWNEDAKRRGVRERVFVGSMMDWAEVHPDANVNRQFDAFRGRFFNEIVPATPNLDYLMLTKRAENLAAMVPWKTLGAAPRNVWLGTTVESQDYSWRITELAAIPAWIRFLSCEPLLGPLNLGLLGTLPADKTGGAYVLTHERINWVIAGVESGHGARYCDLEWLRALRDECATTETPFFLKQATEVQPITSAPDAPIPIRIGAGSKRKNKGYAGAPIVELPYLDNVQHAAVPESAYAA